MQHVLSTHVFCNHRLSTVWLDKIWQAGIPAVELFCTKQHIDYHNRAQVAELGHWFRDAELKLHSVHSPMYTDDVWGRSGPNAVLNITEVSKPRRLNVVEEIKRALEIAETIPFKYLIQHIGVFGEEYDDRKVEAAFSALEEISLYARQRGVDVLLENIPNAFSSAERLIYFLGTTHLKLNLCFDVGHAQMMEGIGTAYSIMKSRIRSTHIHDNDGVKDLHLLPFAEGGAIDWKSTMELLRSQPDQYPLLLELHDTPEFLQSLPVIKEALVRLESA